MHNDVFRHPALWILLVGWAGCAAPAPPVAPAVAAIGCPREVATIGVPAVAQQAHVDRGFVGGAASPDGCTIAVWTTETLYTSWDGGQSFTQTAVSVGLARVAVAAHRIEVLDGARLGTLAPDQALGVVWRPLGDVKPGQLAAAGSWTAILGEHELAYSRDDGATWRHRPLPDTREVRDATLDPSGRLELDYLVEHLDEAAGGCADASTTYERWITTLGSDAWNRSPAIKGYPAGRRGDWTYSYHRDGHCDHFGETALLATHAGQTSVAIDHTRAGMTVGGGFLTFEPVTPPEPHLLELVGSQVVDHGAMPYSESPLTVLDTAGAAILVSNGAVRRWTSRGWRTLLRLDGAT